MIFMRFYPRVEVGGNVGLPPFPDTVLPFRDGRTRYMRVTPKRGQLGLDSVYGGLNHQFLAQQFHRGQNLFVLPPLAIVRLEVGPTDHPSFVNKEIGPI